MGLKIRTEVYHAPKGGNVVMWGRVHDIYTHHSAIWISKEPHASPVRDKRMERTYFLRV